MKDYLKGWKEIKQIYIPPIGQKGFAEDIIIRKYIPPMNNKVDLEPEYWGDDPTVLLHEEEEICAFIKRKATGEIVELSKDEFIIGKSSEADYVIRDNPTISRKHVKITKKGGEYWIEDLNSANHSYLDGKQLTEPKKLLDEMQIKLSNKEVFEFIVKLGQ